MFCGLSATLGAFRLGAQGCKPEVCKPAKYNPRKDLKPGDPAYEKIKRSLHEFGYVDPVIWNEVTGNIVGGHQRYKVLTAEGATEIDCVVVHIENPQEEKALNIALNKAVGEWEPVALADLLNDLKLSGYDVDATGFDAAEIDDLFSKVHDKDVKDDDCDIDPEQIEPFVQPGDIWLLGRHRMLCGDSTSEADVTRVSTSSEEQLTSYEAQVKHYTEYIKSKETSDNWQFVDVYTDKGITGVSTKKREGFNRMIQDALAGRIDLIITKSGSRFARNTVDTLTAIRKLKEYGVEVYFEEQNIYTLDGKGEVLLTIMSSIAQEESRNIFENVTWGMRKRFADGKVTMPYGQFMGYRRGKDGTPEVVEAEAGIVRTIFRRFLEGATPAMISRELNLAGILCPSRKSLLSENEAEIAKARKKTSR